MLEATTKFTGHAAWLIFRQAEHLYSTGKLQVVLLRRHNTGTVRELGVYNPSNETLVVFGPHVVVHGAIDAGINDALPSEPVGRDPQPKGRLEAGGVLEGR